MMNLFIENSQEIQKETLIKLYSMISSQEKSFSVLLIHPSCFTSHLNIFHLNFPQPLMEKISFQLLYFSVISLLLANIDPCCTSNILKLCVGGR